MFTDDVELHSLFSFDESVKVGVAASLRTVADGLLATAARLEGEK